MAKSERRLLARELRRKGISIREIASKVGVSRSSASLWCRDIELTVEQVEKLKNQEIIGGMAGRMKAWRNKIEERKVRVRYYGDIGSKKVGKLSARELFILGLSLYWAEGSKGRRQVIFTNSDPTMIMLFLDWLRTCFDIKTDRLICRVQMNLVAIAHQGRIETYWSRLTGVPLRQFNKTTVITSTLKKTYDNQDNYKGLLVVKVSKSTNMSYQIEGAIERLRESVSLVK